MRRRHTTAEEYISRLRFRAAYTDCRDAYGGTRGLALKGLVGREFVLIVRKSGVWCNEREHALLTWPTKRALLTERNE